MSLSRVVVATPLSQELYRELSVRLPDFEIVVAPELLPPRRWPGDFSGDPAFSRTQEQQREFEALLDSADILFGIPDVDPAALTRTVRHNPALRWVHTMAAGGGAQVKAAHLSPDELQRITFTTSAGVHATPLAEFALFGVLAGAKNFGRLRVQQEQRLWSDRWQMRRLAELTVVVVGLGGIGLRTAELLRGLGVRVIGITRDGGPRGDLDIDVMAVADLTHAATQADALVVTLPGTEATTGLVDATVLGALRPGATVVSVGRGSVIAEPALIAALESGQVGGAVMDVFAVEPLPPHSPLWQMPQVIVSPHTAATSDEEERLIVELFVDNARRLGAGLPLRNIVNTIEFY